VRPLSEPLNYPPAKLSGNYTSHGSIDLKSGQSITLPKGRHYCTGLKLTGNAILNVSGQVKLYVDGPISIDGNTEVANAGSIPANLEIYVLGSAPINMGKNNLFASIYAPNSPVYMNGNCDLFGSIIAKSIEMKGNNTIHYDTALDSVGNGPPVITLVK
jgi:hypothetical protein